MVSANSEIKPFASLRAGTTTDTGEQVLESSLADLDPLIIAPSFRALEFLLISDLIRSRTELDFNEPSSNNCVVSAGTDVLSSTKLTIELDSLISLFPEMFTDLELSAIEPLLVSISSSSNIVAVTTFLMLSRSALHALTTSFSMR
ncbi:hypothetical protein WICMUC_000999 [Wickerhamomyces mucosus]|uniref:Uncharacterized protein n=1 Tax=Wickerhamomyces mucosus TaxID=1378264 RepID=A0A9P8PY96_9ASCO|nr:hypothetical protein WICMUC_000999 [Wickerhamomyces mucosus]